MEKHNFMFLIPVLVLFLSACNTKKKQELEARDLPVIETPYLGQKFPGLTPEPFAPSMITTKGWEYGGAFTPNMKEFYFIMANSFRRKI